MKKILILVAVTLILTAQIFSGVVKKSKTSVTFKKFGEFSSVQTEKISAQKKLSDSQNDFKGKGLLGGLAGKTILRSGEFCEIIDLSAMTIYKVNHKKKTYQVLPIKKITGDEEAGETGAQGKDDESEEGKSDIKIIRNEFEVKETGELQVINEFPGQKYTVTWILEWEDTSTGRKGKDRLFTILWTTPLTTAIKDAQAEELGFFREYFKKIGLDTDAFEQDILGSNWLAVFNSISEEKSSPQGDSVRFAKEMKKIKGYPILIDGKYYFSREGGESAEEDEGKGVKKLFGKLSKKIKKKKPEPTGDEEPTFSYYIEVLELSPATVSEDEFKVPADYKKK